MTSFPYKILCKKKERNGVLKPYYLMFKLQFLSDLDLVRVMLTWAPTQRLLTDGQLLENICALNWF